jgi:hypothetical protein
MGSPGVFITKTKTRMKKRLLARIQILLLLFVSLAVHAQKRTVTGRVTDTRDGSPIQGVSVLPKGSRAGVVTGADGSFQISLAPDTKTLVFSSVGYGLKEVPVTDGPIQVTLTTTGSSLNEVVVIGYGSVKKKDLTGSIATVGEKDFQ